MKQEVKSTHQYSHMLKQPRIEKSEKADDVNRFIYRTTIKCMWQRVNKKRLLNSNNSVNVFENFYLFKIEHEQFHE